MAVPEDLERYFMGDAVLAERFGLPRIEVRRRVIQVAAVYGMDTEEPHVARDVPVREYRSPEGSAAAMRKLEADGLTGLEQVGIMVWLTADELAALLASRQPRKPMTCPRCQSPTFGLAVGGKFGPKAQGVCGGCGHVFPVEPSDS